MNVTGAFYVMVAFYLLIVYTAYILLLIIVKYDGGDVMQAQVRAWGNSQGIRLPKDILNQAGILLNDKLDVQVSDGMIKLVKPFRHKTLEERASVYGGRLNLDGEFDWGEPVGREEW